jgi:thiol-disulfide isomerase/thioredoxin
VSSTAETPEGGEQARAGLGWPIWAALLVGLLVSGWVLIQATSKPDVTGMQGYARGSLARLQMSADQPAAPANTFQGPDGRLVRIADLPGRVKVVNLWATNCAPCIIEMPTLAALAKSYPAGQVSVTPISLDPVGLTDKARGFIAKHEPLAFHQDSSFAIAFAMKAGAMPTTVIYDAQGRERARLLGAAEWDGPEARALFDRLLAE